MNLALTPYARHRAAQLPQNLLQWVMLLALLWVSLVASPFGLKPTSGQIDSLNTASGPTTLWQAASRLGLQASAQQSASAEPITGNSAGKATGELATGAPKFSGSGPAPGVIAITDETSVAALKNYKSSGRDGIEFVFDPTTNTFAVGKPKAGLFDGSPHEQLARSISANESKVLGGTFSKNADGSITITDNSGHYGRRWSSETLSSFQNWLSNRLGTQVNFQSYKP